MSNENQSKINQLLVSQPQGVVFQANWLAANGYSYDLQKRYRKSRWLESVGTGAMIRAGAQVGYEGAVYALQKQTGLSVHPGGRSAFSLLGKAHYLELSRKKIILFGGQDENLPAWFQKHDWGVAIEYYPSSFLPPDLGLTEIELKNFSIKASGATRAMMECLYLAPKEQSLTECFELMEGLNNLKPGAVQGLLERCASVKVKRLFLYLAEKAGHGWVRYLNLQNVDLGRGKRSLVKNGVYIDKYRITIPRELEADERNDL